MIVALALFAGCAVAGWLLPGRLARLDARRHDPTPLIVSWLLSMAGLLLAAAGGVEGVAEDRPARVVTDDLGQDGLELRLWFWVDPRATDLARARSEVLEAAEQALTEAGVRLAVPQPSANTDLPARGPAAPPTEQDREAVT
jgi:small-conductance mechanosensitive channel